MRAAAARLVANTTYFVRFSSTSGADNNDEYRWKTVLNAFGETTTPADNGWTLADELDYRYDANSWTAAADLAAYLRINATIAPTPNPWPPRPAPDFAASPRRPPYRSGDGTDAARPTPPPRVRRVLTTVVKSGRLVL